MPREPATWSTRDRAVWYRHDALRFQRMAQAETLPSARAQLADLAWRYRRAAARLQRKPVVAA